MIDFHLTSENGFIMHVAGIPILERSEGGYFSRLTFRRDEKETLEDLGYISDEINPDLFQLSQESLSIIAVK